MASYRQINALSQDIYFGKFTYISFDLWTIYMYSPLIKAAVAPENWSSKG